MNKLYEPEVIPAINGKCWTIVRVGRDDQGAYQDWIGQDYDNYQDAVNASTAWEKRLPSFGTIR